MNPPSIMEKMSFLDNDTTRAFLTPILEYLDDESVTEILVNSPSGFTFCGGKKHCSIRRAKNHRRRTDSRCETSRWKSNSYCDSSCSERRHLYDRSKVWKRSHSDEGSYWLWSTLGRDGSFSPLCRPAEKESHYLRSYKLG
jgi:hypothetical protein